MKMMSEYTEVISSSDAEQVIECKYNACIFIFTLSKIMFVISIKNLETALINYNF